MQQSAQHSTLVMAKSKLMIVFLKDKVCGLLDEKIYQRQISRRLNVSWSITFKWRTNAFRLSRTCGSGRKKTNPRTDRSIVWLVISLEVLLKQELDRSSRDISDSLIESVSSCVRKVIQISGSLTKYTQFIENAPSVLPNKNLDLKDQLKK